jgi:glycosyltransferase involved in cell wall biosynthesis
MIVIRQGVSLVNNGHKVTYIVSDTEPDEYLKGINIISTGYKPKSRLRRMLFSKRHIWTKVKNIDADVFQISEPELLPLGLRLKRNGKKVVFNLREYYPIMVLGKHYLPTYVRKMLSSALEKYMRFSLAKYDATISCMPEINEFIKSRLNKCKVFEDAANFPVVDRNFTLSFDEYKQRGDVVSYIGTIYSISRQEVVFDALAHLPKIHYLLAGVINDPFYYEKLIHNPYWNNVEFINGFKRDALPLIFGRSSIGNVLRDFSNTETPQGSMSVLKIFECMEAALPILSPDVSLYREFVDRYHCGICVDPNNSEEIKEAIQYIIENKEEAYQMGQNGRRAIIEEFNWESQYQIYEKVLLQVVNN